MGERTLAVRLDKLQRKAMWYKVILGIVIVAVIGSGLYFYKHKKVPPLLWETAVATKGDLQVTILCTGSVDPENRVEIRPPVAGRVEEVLVQEGDRVKKGQTLAWMSSTERAALLDAASAQGPKVLAQWQEMYKATPILAPIDGTIIKREVESGQTFSSTDQILVMSDRLSVKAQVDETDIAQVHRNQAAIITLDAYPNQEIQGRVDKIAFDATTSNNVTVYIVDVIPQKTPDFMRSGMTANVKLQVEQAKDVIIIPAAAILYEDGKTFVQKRSKNRGPGEKVPVQVGLSDGKQVAVQGLEEGTEIVYVSSNFLLNSKSAANANPLSPGGPKGKKK
ncbi:MAG: efflux RND transporter periplasmic adaptor subunit [Bacteriovoracaceae bacterium]|nr:efflux RND transporter periplasmic adaptor subunit [Bacteriovoracaceae bacterium]